jgi:succinate dehydrogenase / fumarate reductase, cytochrome b subunit
MAQAKTDPTGRNARPTSPHLQVYRPLVNMMMSIIHRLTGVALYLGTFLLAWWLTAAATSESYFNTVNALFGSVPGRIVLFGYTWALMHHMLGGLRHFLWDTGRGYDLATIDKLSWGTLVGSIVLTAMIWFPRLAGLGV